MYGSQWPGFVSYFIRQKIFVFVFHNQGGHFFLSMVLLTFVLVFELI